MHAHHLAKTLGHEPQNQIRVVTEGRATDRSENDEEIFDESLPFDVLRLPRGFPVIRQWRRIHAVRRQLREWEPDVLIASGRFPLWTCASFVPNIRCTKVAVLHGTEAGAPGSILRRITLKTLTAYEKIISVSRFTRAYFELNPADPRVSVIPNGVLRSQLNRAKRTSARLEGSPALITVGNVTSRKGQDNVIRALPTLIHRFPNLRYHIVGLPTERARFTRLAEELGVGSLVEFHGAVTNERLEEMLAGADLFLMLSQATLDGDVEGFGIALLEANAFGVPGVGSKGCGIEDAIDDRNSGILVDAANPDAVTNAVEEILQNRMRFSESASRWAASHSWDKIGQKYARAIWDSEAVSDRCG